MAERPASERTEKATPERLRKAREEGKKRVILFNLSGHGLMDMPSYDAYMSGRLGE